ncbi:MFS transporter [Paenarthrobacter sp. AB444]|uniref:MFS transporter n=1 Tax=Paenarthrobacter sp. AB444 TaxID=3025681 RepID=UPI0023667592|nr:MFS transporter [Paenarthrobacter sp. AB444]MDD7833837.1 MFS transporter [Paenarthrobacter sp. AB444]
MKKVITAAAIGNFIEWYDFAVYGYLATVLAANFFPGGNPTTALLETFAVFAVAFALRPLGGIYFGRLGDKIGRKKTLSLTVLLISGSTAFIGLLPNFASLGLCAPALLVLARCVQGFSAGGEYAGACAYVIEHAPREQKARYASFVPVSTFWSFAFAAGFTFLLSQALGPAAMGEWGWRIPFLMALPLGFFGFYLRYRLEETPVFQNIEGKAEVAPSPLSETFREHWRTILALAGFISATALSFYTFTTYMSTFLQVVGHLSQPQALLSSCICQVLAGLLCPFMGRLSDRIGRRKTTMGACLILILAVFPAFMMGSTGNLAVSILGQLLLGIGAVLTGIVTAVLMSELFPTMVRYTASAVTYNLAYTVFGGTAPFVATWLIAETGNKLAPAFYLVAVCLMALFASSRLPETSKRSLNWEAEKAAP